MPLITLLLVLPMLFIWKSVSLLTFLLTWPSLGFAEGHGNRPKSKKKHRKPMFSMLFSPNHTRSFSTVFSPFIGIELRGGVFHYDLRIAVSGVNEIHHFARFGCSAGKHLQCPCGLAAAYGSLNKVQYTGGKFVHMDGFWKPFVSCHISGSFLCLDL